MELEKEKEAAHQGLVVVEQLLQIRCRCGVRGAEVVSAVAGVAFFFWVAVAQRLWCLRVAMRRHIHGSARAHTEHSQRQICMPPPAARVWTHRGTARWAS